MVQRAEEQGRLLAAKTSAENLVAVAVRAVGLGFRVLGFRV